MDDADRALLLARAKARAPDREQRRRIRRERRERKARRGRDSRHSFDGQAAEAEAPEEPRRAVPVAGPRTAPQGVGRLAPPPPPGPAPAPEARSLSSLASSSVLRRAVGLQRPAAPPEDSAPLPDLADHGITLPPTGSRTDEFWSDGLRALLGWVTEHGTALPEVSDRWEGRPVGRWVRAQRRRRAQLDAAQVAALEAVPGWVWDEEEARWEQGFHDLSLWAARHGHAGLPRHAAGVGIARLGQWAAHQRALQRRGRLSEDRVARLEALPGWRWDLR